MPFDGGRILRHLAGDPLSPPPLSTPFSPSLTYELYYGLKEKPFSLSADPRFLHRSPTHAPAFDELVNGIRRREGLIVLTGEIGTGKTTLIRSVLQNLDRRTFSAFVPDPFVSREDLLKMLLVDFGVVSIADLKRGSLAGASRPDLTYPLYEFLDSLVPLQAFAVAIFDEAQNLPLRLIEEIRILSDLEEREKLLQVVLVGQPELRDHLKLPEMRQVDQRMSVRCELSPLRLEDIAGYVRHRLNIAGDGDSRVEFSDAAIEAVHQGSGGTPRVINKICDRALMHGYAARVGRIDADFVVHAIRDLGLQLAPTVTAVVAPEPVTAASPPPVPAPAPHASESTSEPETVEHTGEAEPAEPKPLPAATPNVRGIVAPDVTAPTAIDLAKNDSELTLPMLSEFAAESDLQRSVPVIVEPARSSWTIVGAGVLLAFIAAIGTLLYLMAAAYDFDVSVMTLPAAPPRAPHPTLTLPGVPSPWLTPTPAGKPRQAQTSVVAPTGDRFAIQVASFTTQERADSLIDELTRGGFTARAVTIDVGSPRGQPVLVLVGGYGSAQEAASDLAKVRERFPDAHLEPVATR